MTFIEALEKYRKSVKEEKELIRFIKSIDVPNANKKVKALNKKHVEHSIKEIRNIAEGEQDIGGQGSATQKHKMKSKLFSKGNK